MTWSRVLDRVEENFSKLSEDDSLADSPWYQLEPDTWPDRFLKEILGLKTNFHIHMEGESCWLFFVEDWILAHDKPVLMTVRYLDPYEYSGLEGVLELARLVAKAATSVRSSQ